MSHDLGSPKNISGTLGYKQGSFVYLWDGTVVLICEVIVMNWEFLVSMVIPIEWGWDAQEKH